MNSLTVLGGSAAGIGTGQGCSGYLLEIDDSRIVLDLGPSTLIELRKHADYRALDGIVISHLHMDHVLDLFILRFMLKHNPVKPERKTPLYLPPNGLAFMEKAAELWETEGDDVDSYFTEVYEMTEYDPEQPLQIGAATITFAPTVHVIPCWAMRVQPAEGDDLIYTADTGSDADLDEFVKDAAVIIADSAATKDAPDEVKRTVHCDAEAVAKLAARAEAQHLVLSHMWEELDPMNNAMIARDHFLGRISVGQPGLTVTW